MNTRVLLRCVGFIDRRGKRELEAARHLAQERADQALEALWRQRVADHPIERRRLLRGDAPLATPVVGLLRRQAA